MEIENKSQTIVRLYDDYRSERYYTEYILDVLFVMKPEEASLDPKSRNYIWRSFWKHMV